MDTIIEEEEVVVVSQTKAESVITKRDLMRVFYRSLTLELSWNFVRQMHGGFVYAMSPIIQKLYRNKEDRAKALQRHLEFFNITPYCSTIVFGIVIAMEEQNTRMDNYDVEAINNIKASLMGPLSGIGDCLFLGTWRIICAGIGISIASTGNYFGGILFLVLYNIPALLLRYVGLMKGYELGTALLDKLQKSGLMDRVMSLTGILGLMTLGSMIATMVVVKVPMSFGSGKAITSLQSTLDTIMPCLLPALITGIIYWLLTKRVNVTHILIGIIVLSIIGTYFGIVSV